MKRSEINPYDLALRKLAQRDQTVFEVRASLMRVGVTDSEIHRTVRLLKDRSLLNDDRFASHYAIELYKKGYGVQGINQKFKKKGLNLSLENISTMITDQSEPPNQCIESLEKKSALNLVNKRYPTLFKDSMDDKLQARVMRFLIRRGFQINIVRDLFFCEVNRERINE